MKPVSGPLKAILLMLFSMACFSAMNIVIRMLFPGMHPTQMVFIRNVFSFFIVVLWSVLLSGGQPNFTTARLKGHFWRASIGICAMELWFRCVTIMPVTLATALSFTTPIFSTIFAILFLGEKAGIRRWGAIAMGFAGMLIILRPDQYGISHTAAFVLMSSALMAVSGVLVKTLTRTEPPETIVFYMTLFMIPWSLPPAIVYWQPVTLHQAGLLFLVALFSTVAHLTIARAYKFADMVALMPLDFTRLIFTALFAYLMFGETLATNVILGSLVIVASTVYIARREVRQKKMVTTVTTGPVAP